MTYTRNYKDNMQRNRQQRSDQGRSDYSSPQRFGRRNNRPPKALPSHLFIKKADEDVLQQDIVQSTAKFTDYALSEKLQANISFHGYETPTPIQEAGIPPLLEDKDVIGIANTGTGKTAAFLLPLIQKVDTRRNERVLIVTPTRELAMQILDEFNVFARGMSIQAVLCIGGANIGRQERNLGSRPSFVIGTPGRLKDLIKRRKLDLSQFGSIVLDEVDRMVDIGFIKDIQFLISLLPQNRHSLFFSATLPDNVNGILNSFVKNPVRISVKKQETSKNVEQNVIRVIDKNRKVDMLHDLLITDGFDKVLVFGRTKWGIEKLTKTLLARGFKAASIHGNKSQNQRQRALDDFKKNHVKVLLATDVASRGLDIDDVTHVINYDAPDSYEEYVHRIGRTGRADKKGTALTFVE